MTASTTGGSSHRSLWAAGAWLAFIATAIGLWFLYGRHVLEPEEWVDWVENNLILASLIYGGLLALRGATMIPSTPLLLAGIVLFPGPWVWALNMIGILASSALVYSLVRAFGFDYLVRRKYRERVRQLTALMRKHDFPVIIGWSLFPMVPTDVIVYTAATLRLPLARCLSAVAIGEGILITFYVAGGTQVLAGLR